MFKTARFSLLTVLLTGLPAFATTEFIFETATGHKLSLQEFNSSLVLQPGAILTLGETHASQGDLSANENQRRQVALLRDLSGQLVSRNLKLDVGMEFLEYPRQNTVDQYLNGSLSDDEFTEAAGWGKNPFAAYKEQILAPRSSGGTTWALNIPRSVTSQVSQGGLNSLSEEQKALLPPSLERGNDSYYERFKAVMAGHVPDEKIADYFWAQSIWDETMAWNSLRNWAQDRVQVIIVGAFHVEYGGGLPDRLKARGATSVKTLLQVPLEQLDDKSIDEATRPNSVYGARADYLWLYQEAD